MPQRELKGLGAIVTGSTGNLGRATVKALAEAGAKVLINGRNSEKKAVEIVDEIKNAGGTALSLMADVTDEISVKRMIETAVTEFGRLDILVNNVGPANKGPVTAIPYKDWRNIMAHKLDSAFLTIKYAVPYLAKGGRGAIINVGASSAHTGNPQRSVDVAAKMGLAGLTGSLAVELAPQNITVNCVAPGRFHKPGTEVSEHFANGIPAGREGDPVEFAETIRFLVGPHSRYTSGQTLHINGAWYVSIN